MSQPNSNNEIVAEFTKYLHDWAITEPELSLIIGNVNRIIAQKDAEVADREKYVPRFKGVNIFSGEEVEGAGCYTSEKGTAYILEDNNGEEPTFTPVKEINYDWYTPKE